MKSFPPYIKFSCPGSYRAFAVAAFALLVFSGMAAAEIDPVVAANRLENRGIELWKKGQHEEGAKLIEESIAADPTNPQRLLNYGSLLMLQAREKLGQGDAKTAAEILSESERHLSAAVRLGEGLHGKKRLAGQGFFLLGEIAYYGRDDKDRAAKFYQSAALRAPEDQRIPAALERVGIDPAEVAESEPVSRPLNHIGTANAVMMDGKRFRLAREDENRAVKVQEYVLPGETAENWTRLFARREHGHFVAPETYASLLAEQAAKQGGKVISTAKGPGDSASVAFVIHAPSMSLSEVNAWILYVEGGKLFSEQFARRVSGLEHHTNAENIALEQSGAWLRELQGRRPVSLVKTSAVADGL